MTDHTAGSAVERAELVTNPRAAFTNSSAPGVNRIITVGEYLLVNNIGRNYEFWSATAVPYADTPVGDRGPSFDVTIFPGEDFPSVFDVDVHAAFIGPDRTTLLVHNHYGRVRAFPLPLPARGTPTPAYELQLLGDTERVLLVDGCFIVSSPRGEYTIDRPQPGIFLSDRITPDVVACATQSRTPYPLPRRQALADWGTVTTLAADPGSRLLAVATGERVGLFELTEGAQGIDLGRCRWETAVPHHTQWLQFDSAHDRLLVAGHDPAPLDEAGDNWNACRGGAVAAFSLAGAPLWSAALPETTAWGYGADPLALSRDGALLYAIDRRAGLHGVSLATQRCITVSEPLRLERAGEPSLGIGHCHLLGSHLYAGFSRGGYRLFDYRVTPARTARPGTWR